MNGLYLKYPATNHPNLVIYTGSTDEQLYKCRIISKKFENKDDIASLATALGQLKRREVDFVAINGRIFTRESFKFRQHKENLNPSNKFNASLAIDVFTNTYHLDIVQDFLSFCKKNLS